MAEKHWNCPDDINQVLYLRPDSPKGYKREYLLQSLSEMEEQFIICPCCEGIMRDASTYEGQITCHLCSENKWEAKAVKQVRTLVAKLEIKCPLLRDCDWTGQLTECDEHFGICASALLLCPVGCDGVFRRSQIEEHLNNGCPLRKVNCNFCSNNFQFKDLNDHIGICPDQPINCECGAEIPHSRKEVHIETECPLTEVECPYAKYSCKIGSIHRKDLLAHKKEFYIEHQDMLEAEASKLQEAMKTKKDLTEIQLLVNLKDPNIDRKIPKSTLGGKILCYLLSVDPILVRIRNNENVMSHSYINKWHMHNQDVINIHECRLILNKTSKMKESYFEVIKMNSKDEREDVIKLEKEVYSNYIQEDGSLVMRLFIDF